jgi:hypothetical protein
MVLIVTALAALLLKNKNRRFSGGIFAAGAVIVLIFSYSRSAWIGTLLSLALLVLITFKTSQIKKFILPVLAMLLVIGGTTAWFHRHNPAWSGNCRPGICIQ